MDINKTTGKNRLFQQLIADGEIQRIPMELIDRDENQPRSIEEVKAAAEALQPSIEKNGIVQMPVYQAKENGRYLIIVGECRTEAARLNGDAEVSAVVKTFADDEDAKRQIDEIRYAENDRNTRKNLTPLDEAKFWHNYMEKYFTDKGGKPQIKKAAEHLGIEQTRISHFLGIHRASDSVKQLIKSSNITDYQLAYIMARMEKHEGLVDQFIEKVESADVKGGIQKLANTMLKEANNRKQEESNKSKTLDLPPKTAEEAEAERQKKIAEEKAEAELRDGLIQTEIEQRNKAAEEKRQQQEQEEAAKEEAQPEQEQQEQQQEQSTEDEQPQEESSNTKQPCSMPSNTGTVCLKLNKNTAILSTIANQPATLTKDQAQALAEALIDWVDADE